MQEKTIKRSSRGLTFSYPSKGLLQVGSTYDYIIEKETKHIRIVPSASGRYKVSRKKNGSKYDSLIDLRNKEVLDAISSMVAIRISVSDVSITVSDAAEEQVGRGVISFPRKQLRELRMAAGMGSIQAVDSLLEATQISLDEWLAESRKPLHIDSVQHDLADIYTVVSLFSGAGILDWPFLKDTRFKIQYAIDYDGAACETYRHNIGEHIVHGDVHKAFTENGFDQDKEIGNPDIIIGGPSCKPFSNANRHTRLADHPDSDLIMQYMRIVKKLHPKVFAIENVPEVLSACDGSYFDALCSEAKNCGYEIGAKVVQDNKVGGYTTRKRAVIIGSCIGPVSFPDFELVSGGHTAGEALSKVNDSWTNYADLTSPSEETKKRMSFVPQGGNYQSIPEEYQTKSRNRHSCTYRRLAWNEPSPTIVNWRKPPLIHPTEDRTLTVAEAKALQGLPGDFLIKGTLGQKQQQVGNSVPVAIGRFIKNAILAILTRVYPHKREEYSFGF